MAGCPGRPVGFIGICVGREKNREREKGWKREKKKREGAISRLTNIAPTRSAAKIDVLVYSATRKLSGVGLGSNYGCHVYGAGRLNPLSGEYIRGTKPKLRGYARSGSNAVLYISLAIR